MAPRYCVGIDLGTTHCALAIAPFDPEDPAPTRMLPLPQLVTRSACESQTLLPSFLYFATQDEGALPLPWDAQRGFAVGQYARQRAAEAPTRVISSAKSWLSHTGLDRRSGILPAGAPGDIEKISPVEASFRYLDHLAEAWAHAHAAGDVPPLTEQHIVLTVPASFDAAARELTVEAAYCAGMEDVTLLEEPQAAVYAWLEAQGARFTEQLQVGDVVLVIDIGGGTTDFSAIAVGEDDGQLTLTRVAVGDHILLGGDNMDLALAQLAATKLRDQGHELDRWQLMALAHGCRAAKERLLALDAPDDVPVVVASRGSALVGGSLRTELTRAEVARTLVDGFFPRVASDARPATRARAALTQLGLPYAADPGVTRHLAAFLGRQSGAAGETNDGALLRPTAVLFNGGVVKAPAIRERIVSVLDEWLAALGAPPVRVLTGEDPDLAVARGAAHFGRVQQGRGIRVRGGTAQAYYVGIESPMPAVPGMEPPLDALCVAPLGMEEGSPPAVLAHELGVVVGQPVTFRFFVSSVRRGDDVGTLLTDVDQNRDVVEVAPLEITFPAEGRAPGDVVPVQLRSHVTAIGTLKLEAVPRTPRAPDEAFAVELSVRSS